jgi:molybdopterin converting factor small subunit
MQAIQLRYFALLREERGLAAEVIETAARTPRDLYQELAGRHGFSLPAERVGVAINESFAAMDRELAANDVVVFIPPVAGG